MNLSYEKCHPQHIFLDPGLAQIARGVLAAQELAERAFELSAEKLFEASAHVLFSLPSRVSGSRCGLNGLGRSQALPPNPVQAIRLLKDWLKKG